MPAWQATNPSFQYGCLVLSVLSSETGQIKSDLYSTKWLIERLALYVNVYHSKLMFDSNESWSSENIVLYFYGMYLEHIQNRENNKTSDEQDGNDKPKTDYHSDDQNNINK